MSLFYLLEPMQEPAKKWRNDLERISDGCGVGFHSGLSEGDHAPPFHMIPPQALVDGDRVPEA